MVTEKLYYQDQYLGRFKATVLKSATDEEDRNYVVLDQTAFYPTGGGQPHDTGVLNNIEVYDVEVIGNELRHYIEEPIEVHTECVGEINWERRMDHMQQHAGQHILSAVLEEEFGYKTISFHLGEELCSIDIDTNKLSEEEANQAEKVANIIILENRPIETKWVTKEELSKYQLRKEVSVSEDIRLVIIPDFDYNGCGGTHPKTTGQVGSIEILHWEKQKGHLRLYFVCGRRVREQLHNKHKVIQNLTKLLSSPQEHLISATERLLDRTKELEKTILDLNLQIIENEAERLIASAESGSKATMIKKTFMDRPMSELQQLAKIIVGKSELVIVFFVNETDEKLQIVCARGESYTIQTNALIKQVLPLINGKGGGNEAFAQGGGEKIVSAEELMNQLVESIST